MHNRAFFDANIWVSRTLTDWVCLVGLEKSPGIYDILWSEDVFAEALNNLREMNRAHSSNALENRFQRLRDSAPRGKVEGFEILDRSHPDTGDWHVINAALHGGATYLVTNDSGFTRIPDPDSYPFEIHTADSFFMLVADSAPELIRDVTVAQHEYWSAKNVSFNLARQLDNAGTPMFAELVRGVVYQEFHI